MEVEKGGDCRKWEELIPDALILILKKLPLKDLLVVIPVVCKAWEEVLKCPQLWQEIDIHEWCTQNKIKRDKIDRMFRLLIPRSCGLLQSLHVSMVTGPTAEETFNFIAQHTGSLQTLKLTGCNLSGPILENVAGKISTITSLEIVYCYGVGTKGLEAIGKSCKLLSRLSWSMDPKIVTNNNSGLHAEVVCAILKSMPKLKHLKLAGIVISRKCIVEMFAKCTDELECLDLSGCFGAEEFDARVLENKPLRLSFLCPGLMFRGPGVGGGLLDGRVYDDVDDDDDDYYYYHSGLNFRSPGLMFPGAGVGGTFLEGTVDDGDDDDDDDGDEDEDEDDHDDHDHDDDNNDDNNDDDDDDDTDHNHDNDQDHDDDDDDNVDDDDDDDDDDGHYYDGDDDVDVDDDDDDGEDDDFDDDDDYDSYEELW